MKITKVCLFSDISNTAKNEIEMDMGKVRSGQVRSSKVRQIWILERPQRSPLNPKIKIN